MYVCMYCFEIGSSYVVHVGLELTVGTGLASDSCLSLPRGGIKSVHHHTRRVWF